MKAAVALLTSALLPAAALAGCGSGSHATPAGPQVSTRPGPAAVSLSPGVVTVARLRTPAGNAFTLTLQRVRFQGREYLCLNANTTQAGPAAPTGVPSTGTSSAGECPGPLPLPKSGLIAVAGDPTGCKPKPFQLLWGLARRNVSVALASAGAERTATRRTIPLALRAGGDLFYVWASTTPDHLVARDRTGNIVQSHAVNDTARPYSCR